MNKNIVVMFPYPSGSGLHVGHWYNYAIVDSYCRWQKYLGHNVKQPFGYDAFGLPAENYAMKIGKDPREVTYNNIENFRKEISRMNTNYEERLITSDDWYVKKTQWLFTKLLENNLAYKANGIVNYCNSCKTTLAREQVIDGKCERCESIIELKELNQWYFKITNYKDRLIKNLDSIDYPEATKNAQRKWLNNLHDWCVSRQRKWGAKIPLENENDTLDTFVDSSFYYLMYNQNNDESSFFNKENYSPIDLYVGGKEHACMHLIYARFIHMFLYDIGIVPQEEPFNKVFHQGMITYNGNKMSKSKGNVVDPGLYDPDVLRMYLMFIGPYEHGGDWNDNGIIGVEKLVKKLNSLFIDSKSNGVDLNIDLIFKQFNNKVDKFKFNTIISDLFKIVNDNKGKNISVTSANKLLEMVKIFAPGFKVQ